MAKQLQCRVHPRYQGKGKPRKDCKACQTLWQKNQGSIEKQVESDIFQAQESLEVTTLKKKNKKLVRLNIGLQRQLEVALTLKAGLDAGFKIRPIRPDESKHVSEATAFMIMSDVHFEEEVKPQKVNGLNTYNIEIAPERMRYFFVNGCKLLRKERQDVIINNLVLALLGDFISNSIHEELVENNQLGQAEAVMQVTEHLIAGINYLLDNSQCELTIICHSGNHGRTTKERRHSTEFENSLETLIYYTLSLVFAGNPKVKFYISPGYHSYLQVYDKIIRFHHGHDIVYRGGVGGIYIPVNKKIAQWNKGIWADLDVMGHWHQFRDGGNFICNGSVMGYSPYALSIGADPERPKQAFFLMDKDRGKTIVAPILLEEVKGRLDERNSANTPVILTGDNGQGKLK